MLIEKDKGFDPNSDLGRVSTWWRKTTDVSFNNFIAVSGITIEPIIVEKKEKNYVLFCWQTNSSSVYHKIAPHPDFWDIATFPDYSLSYS